MLKSRVRNSKNGRAVVSRSTPIVVQQSTAVQEKNSKTYECLYTKHLVKKRKTWTEGFLKVTFSGDRAKAVLMDVNSIRGTVLETRSLESKEVEKLILGEPFTIEFAGYLIEIQHLTPDEEHQQPLKLRKFTPPSIVAVPIKPSEPEVSENSVIVNRTIGRNSSYAVSNEELDDIWELGEKKDSKAENNDNRNHQTEINNQNNPSSDKQTHVNHHVKPLRADYRGVGGSSSSGFTQFNNNFKERSKTNKTDNQTKINAEKENMVNTAPSVDRNSSVVSTKSAVAGGEEDVRVGGVENENPFVISSDLWEDDD